MGTRRAAAQERHGLLHEPGDAARYPGVEFSQFMGAEMLAKKYDLTRTRWTASPESHQRAIAATREGRFKDEIVPVAVRTADGAGSDELHTVDEGIRFDGTLEALPASSCCRKAAASPPPPPARSRRRHRRDGGQRTRPEGAGRQAAGAHPPHERAGPRPGDHAGSPAARHRACAEEGRHEDRRHRPLRGQRGLCLGAAGLAEGHWGADPGAAERERRRHRAGPPAGRLGHQADDDAGARAAPAPSAACATAAADHVRPGLRAAAWPT
jgi:hypothetical protein